MASARPTWRCGSWPKRSPAAAGSRWVAVQFPPWDGEFDQAVDRAIQDARTAISPLHGLDPHDPRDYICPGRRGRAILRCPEIRDIHAPSVARDIPGWV